ncbi:SapB/AmfS family lanthipeptide [Streptomyces sp. B1866]|nr:SapB/AmfS family lanthipeptide [Streptomyces sp. B1866]MDT3400082.1 SapB/AmfS family lanthipeptide [Streptomyces sp. B1866]
MALLDLQNMKTPEPDSSDLSGLSVLLCDKQSYASFLLCL